MANIYVIYDLIKLYVSSYCSEAIYKVIISLRATSYYYSYVLVL